MNAGTKVLLTIAAVVALLTVLGPILKTVLGFVYTIVNVAVGVFWLAIIVAVVLFAVGVVRRLNRA